MIFALTFEPLQSNIEISMKVLKPFHSCKCLPFLLLPCEYILLMQKSILSNECFALVDTMHTNKNRFLLNSFQSAHSFHVCTCDSLLRWFGFFIIFFSISHKYHCLLYIHFIRIHGFTPSLALKLSLNAQFIQNG